MKKNVDGGGSKEEESMVRKSLGVDELPLNSKGRQADVLLSDIVDYCAEGGVHVVSRFSSPQIKCPLVVEGVRVEAVVGSGSGYQYYLGEVFQVVRYGRDEGSVLKSLSAGGQEVFLLR